MGRTGRQTLSIAIVGDEPPSEFRIFTAGEVDTVKGKFLFDEQAAASVMKEYEAHGIDLMVDYDHASLGPMAVDPAQSGKAAAWFNLEVRNGELWAVNVRWTPPAAEALKRKEWRFMSPAFSTDEEGRVTSLLNVAITNLPATRRLEPLMAANAKETLSMLTPETIKKALEAIKNGDSEAAMSLLEEMIASAAGGEQEPDPADPVEPTEPPAEEMNGTTTDEEQAAVAASITRLTRITGKSTIGAAVEEVETWRTSHLELTAEKAKIAKERAALEANERDTLTASIAKKMGPAVAWAEPVKATDRSKRKPAEPFASMPIAELRGFVTKLGAAKAADVVTPPVEGAGPKDDGTRDVAIDDSTIVTLSKREVAMLKGASEEHVKAYATRKASMKKAG